MIQLEERLRNKEQSSVFDEPQITNSKAQCAQSSGAPEDQHSQNDSQLATSAFSHLTNSHRVLTTVTRESRDVLFIIKSFYKLPRHASFFVLCFRLPVSEPLYLCMLTTPNSPLLINLLFSYSPGVIKINDHMNTIQQGCVFDNNKSVDFLKSR